MLKIKFRPAAEEDLIDIWLYGAQQWGRQQADTYLEAIYQRIEQLSITPKLGIARDTLKPGYHSLLTGQHVIYYQLDTTSINIVRVLSQKMEPHKIE